MGYLLLNSKIKESIQMNDIQQQKLRLNNINTLEEYNNIIIDKINKKNSKFKVSEVKYEDIPVPEIGNNAINSGRIAKVNKNEDIETMAYVFISNPSIGSRNAFGSQQLFPGLSKLIDTFIESPGYDLANLPIYFINGTLDNLAQSMKETILAIHLIGITYIQLFNEDLLPDGLASKSLAGYARYITNENEKQKEGIIKTDFFILNENEKKITFISDSLINGGIEKMGSKDRFFVIKAYPALIKADDLKYTIDISQIESFVETYSKESNLGPFIRYANKLKNKGGY